MRPCSAPPLLSLLGFKYVRYARCRATMVDPVSRCAERRISRLRCDSLGVPVPDEPYAPACRHWNGATVSHAGEESVA